MTDKEILFRYRLDEAEESLEDAIKMSKSDVSSRAILNRIYYAMFYLLLALFLKSDINIKTSKLKGIISIFDKGFIKTGKIDKRYSEIIHKTFNVRQKGDYKEFIQISSEDVKEYLAFAEDFFVTLKRLILNNDNDK